MTKPNNNTPKKRVTDTGSFIEKARTIHGETFDYRRVEYRHRKTKVTIICHEHGPFEQRPKYHLDGHGCPVCGRERTNTVTEQKRLKAARAFIAKAQDKHQDKYNYNLVEYQDSRTKVTIICHEHGPFEQLPDNHLKGHGCPVCGRERTNTVTEQKRLKAARAFIAKAQVMPEHQDKYNYNLVEYHNNKTKVIIICHEHGPFEQVPNSHLAGRGCPTCAQELANGWSRSDYIKYAKTRNDGRALLYVIKCQDKKETFYKIGITARSVKERFNRLYDMPYKYEILTEIEGPAGRIWDLEKQLHRHQAEQHYKPRRAFGGSVLECFSDLAPFTRFLIEQEKGA